MGCTTIAALQLRRKMGFQKPLSKFIIMPKNHENKTFFHKKINTRPSFIHIFFQKRICQQRESAPLKSVSTRFPLRRSDVKIENHVLAKKRENKNLKNNHLIREKIDEKRCFIDTP